MTCHRTAGIDSNSHLQPLTTGYNHKIPKLLIPCRHQPLGNRATPGHSGAALVISRFAGDHDLRKITIFWIVSTFGTCGGQVVGYSDDSTPQDGAFCWRKLPPQPRCFPVFPIFPIFPMSCSRNLTDSNTTTNSAIQPSAISVIKVGPQHLCCVSLCSCVSLLSIVFLPAHHHSDRKSVV